MTGLSKALQKKGHLVEIVLPKYDCMEYDRIQDLRVLCFSLIINIILKLKVTLIPSIFGGSAVKLSVAFQTKASLLS